MRTVCVFVLSLVSLNQVACGSSRAQRAVATAAAYVAVEVAATALQEAAQKAGERDAAKRAAADGRHAATGNWRLVRSGGDECASPMSEAQQEDCETKGDDGELQVETEEEGLNLGKCIVCD